MNALIKTYERYDPEEEYLLIKATLVEEQLLAAGAKAGTDYTILDCFKLAVEQMKADAIIELANSK